MTLSSGQKTFVWIILAICLLSIPISLVSNFSNLGKAQEEAQDDHSSNWLIRTRDHIAVVKINGMIMDQDIDPFSSHSGSAMDAKKELRRAIKDKHIKGILLRINSPGGSVACSQEIYDALIALKKTGKPIVVSMGDVAASGGYYIAAAADKIVAEPGTLTGSIGVIMNLCNLQGIEQKLGIKPEVIKSGPFKDMGSPNRPISPAEKTVMEGIIFDAYDQFVTAVATGRKMNRASIVKLADGRVYSGRQAFKSGLVDQLGGYEDALSTLQTMCKDKYKLSSNLPVEEAHGWNFLTEIFQSPLGNKINPFSVLDGIIPESMNSRFYKQPLYVMQ